MHSIYVVTCDAVFQFGDQQAQKSRKRFARIRLNPNTAIIVFSWLKIGSEPLVTEALTLTAAKISSETQSAAARLSNTFERTNSINFPKATCKAKRTSGECRTNANVCSGRLAKTKRLPKADLGTGGGGGPRYHPHYLN